MYVERFLLIFILIIVNWCQTKAKIATMRFSRNFDQAAFGCNLNDWSAFEDVLNAYNLDPKFEKRGILKYYFVKPDDVTKVRGALLSEGWTIKFICPTSVTVSTTVAPPSFLATNSDDITEHTKSSPSHHDIHETAPGQNVTLSNSEISQSLLSMICKIVGMCQKNTFHSL